MTRQNFKGRSGRKLDGVWKHFLQTPLKSPGHYSGECKLCHKKWPRAYVNVLQSHLANECADCPEDIQNYWLGYLAAKDSLEDETASIASQESNQSIISNKRRRSSNGIINHINY